MKSVRVWPFVASDVGSYVGNSSCPIATAQCNGRPCSRTTAHPAAFRIIMTLFIQRAELLCPATHGKLGELLRTEGRVRTELTRPDGEEPETVEQHRAQGRGTDMQT